MAAVLSLSLLPHPPPSTCLTLTVSCKLPLHFSQPPSLPCHLLLFHLWALLFVLGPLDRLSGCKPNTRPEYQTHVGAHTRVCACPRYCCCHGHGDVIVIKPLLKRADRTARAERMPHVRQVNTKLKPKPISISEPVPVYWLISVSLFIRMPEFW